MITEKLYELIDNYGRLQDALDLRQNFDFSNKEILALNKYNLQDVKIRQYLRTPENPVSDRHAAVIFKTTKFKMSWIHKLYDDWYYLVNEDRYGNWTCYKCDTFDGLVQIMDKLVLND